MLVLLITALLGVSDALTTGANFELNQYTVSESDQNFMVCISPPSQTLDTPVQFVVVDDSGTAIRNEDYSALGVFGDFQISQTTPFCFNLSESIVDDDVVEGREVFTLTTVTLDGSRFSALVIISDNDGARFKLVNTVNSGFRNDLISITEANINTTFPVCAELVGGGESGVNRSTNGLNRAAVLLITTMEGTADGTDFLAVSNQTLTFPTGSNNSLLLCEDIFIFGDIVPEDVEMFVISVTTANPLDQIEGPTSSTIIIQNDDATPDCGQPPSPGLRGEVSYNSTLLGAMAVYSCDSGYQLEPSEGEIRFCLLSGRWNGVDPICIIVDCGNLTAPLFGMVSVNQTNFGATAIYTCINGYELLGNNSRTCQAGGNWSSSEPLCEAVDCGSLTAPENGVIDINMTTFNNTASYSCDTGYELAGNQTRTCLASGNWSGSQPSCEVIDCGTLEPPPRGQVQLNSTTYLSLATYSCDAGYTNTSDLVRVCEVSGQWSGVEPNCTDINECESGFPCDEKAKCFNFLGGFNCTCSEGFTGDGRSCSEINECEMEIHGCHANALCTNTVGSFTCSCEEGFNGDGFNCTVIDCGDLTPPLFGDVLYNQTSFGGTAIYNCRYGYRLLGNSSRTCQADGEWSDSEPQCEAIVCGSLAPPRNGAVSFSNMNFVDSLATYTCNPGFSADGGATRTCLVSGVWSGESSQCQEVDCGPVPSISKGSVQYLGDSTAYQSLAVYDCIPGYLLNGTRTRTCLGSGRWSGAAPVCSMGTGSLNEPVVDIVILSAGVSVGGFFLAVILVSIVLLFSVRRFIRSGHDKVYETGSRDPEPLSQRYARPLYDSMYNLDTPRPSSRALSDMDLETRSTEFPLSELSRPTYANLHSDPST